MENLILFIKLNYILQLFYYNLFWLQIISKISNICQYIELLFINYFITKIKDFTTRQKVMINLDAISKYKYVVGKGSFGTVYRYAYEQKQYAMKKIYRDVKNHPQLKEKYEAEGKIMKKLSNHRNIVKYYGQMTQGKYLYILTQFVEGGDLRRIDFLPSEDDLWQIIMQLTLSLNHLRKNKVIHRDIKPQNILIQCTKSKMKPSKDNQSQKYEQLSNQTQIVLKIADFGLAQVIKDSKNPYIEGLAGTPIYLAPEICSDKPYSYQVDIWSLGITLYQLTHNQSNPYQQDITNHLKKSLKQTHKDMFDHLLQIIQVKKIKCSSPYPQINKLIQSMLNLNPKKRPTPLQILQHPKVVQRLIKFNQNVQNKSNMEMGKTLSTRQCFHKLQEQQQIDAQDNLLQQTLKIQPSNNQKQTLSQLPIMSKKQPQDRQLIYSPFSSLSFNKLQLFLESRLSNSIINSLLNFDQQNSENIVKNSFKM